MTEAEWLECSDPQKMLDFLRGRGSDRKLMLFATACLRRVWPLLTHEAIRLGVEVGEQYADGRVSREELLEVWANAGLDTGELLWRGFQAAPGDHCPFAIEIEWEEAGGDSEGLGLDEYWARRGAEEAEANPACPAARAVFYARELVAWEAEPARRPQAVEQEQRAQYALLLDILPATGKPIDPSWLTWSDRTVPKIAQAIYAGRAFGRLPILADALEEAGCDSADILAHCRNGGEHARGCWVVDRILGKE